MQSTLLPPTPIHTHKRQGQSKPKAVGDRPTLGGEYLKSALKANLVELSETRSRTNQKRFLDNIAQLTTTLCINNLETTTTTTTTTTIAPNYESLRKRARAKYYTSNVAKGLYSLDTDLKKSYGQTAWACAQTIQQKGAKFISKYCNQRWCVVCNRIRTAKLIKGYEPVLSQFKDLQFVTLTAPNVKAQFLRKAIKEMIAASRSIQKATQKKHERNPSALQLIGIRKVECTHNYVFDNYHPHFHFLIEGKEAAEHLKAEWLKHYPNASECSQDIRPAKEGSNQELFKYFSKLVTKIDGEAITLLQPLDVIFTAMRGLRTFQALGLKKYISEDIEALQSEIIEVVEPQTALWIWDYSDWVHVETAEALTGHLPSEQSNKLIDGIRLNYATRRRPPILSELHLY
jgi:Replication protein